MVHIVITGFWKINAKFCDNEKIVISLEVLTKDEVCNIIKILNVLHLLLVIGMFSYLTKSSVVKKVERVQSVPECTQFPVAFFAPWNSECS
jgi:hypothetical protein